MDEDFKGNIKRNRTIDIYKASKLSLILFVAAGLLFGVPFYAIWRPEFKFSWQSFFLFTLFFIVGVVLHELIHGLFFGLFAKNRFRAVRFGVIWKYLTPYCHCNEPLKLRHYVISALMPALILGFIPATVSLFNGNLMLLFLGVIFIGAATGDFMVVWKLWRENPESLVQDHPSEAGCFVYRKINS